MYSPESCRPTLGSTRLLFTTLCLQGRGERSLDHVIVGEGNPLKRQKQGTLHELLAQLNLSQTVFFWCYLLRGIQFSHCLSKKIHKRKGLKTTLMQVLPWASQRSVAVCPSITTISGSGTEALGTAGTWVPPSTITSTLVSVVPSMLRAAHTYVPLSSGRATRICKRRQTDQTNKNEN